jgi:transposase InsO family protein
MKIRFSRVGLATLCGWFGITRQAYYKNNWEGVSTTIEEELVIQQVLNIRKNHKRIGARKIHEMIQPFILEHGIKIGRDCLFNLLSANHLLVRKRKRRIRTTKSYHWLRKYPNLIREFVPTAINQLWVSDITYWKIDKEQPLYISFITDAYSHKIVGYHVAETLEAIESIRALKMALSALGAERHFQLIHHSDRGVQYCSSGYVKLLKNNGLQISMTENGDPLENAIAERVNGIIKDEYLDNYQVHNISQANELLSSVVDLYNKERPHMSIGNLTPNQIHQSNQQIKPEKLWKNYYRKQNTFVNQFQD